LIVGIVIVVVGINKIMIVLSGLHLASVAFLSEGKIQIIAFNAYPILGIFI
jgi:hypothetical protein